MGYIKITAEGLPGIFPTFDFKGRFWIEGSRLTRNGYSHTAIRTKLQHQLTNDNLFIQRGVQSQLWRRYELKVEAHEDTDTGLWGKTRNLWIEVNDGTVTLVYKAMLLIDIGSTRKKLADTDKYEYTIDFADIYLNNYEGDQPVSNFLESRTLFKSDEFGAANTFQNLNYLEFNVSSSTLNPVNIDNEFKFAFNQFYGLYDSNGNPVLIPLISTTNMYRIATAIEHTEITILKEPLEGVLGDFTENLSRQVKFKGKRLVFYLKEFEANIVDRYLNYCYNGTSGTSESFYKSITLGANFNTIERLNAKISRLDDAVDLYEVVIELPYEKIDFSPYNQN